MVFKALRREILLRKIKMSKKDKSTHSDREMDILSTIWMFSCTDSIPMMTYKGIEFRMGCVKEREIRNLVKDFEELFRIRVPQQRLNRWKDDMRECKGIPSWIKT